MLSSLRQFTSSSSHSEPDEITLTTVYKRSAYYYYYYYYYYSNYITPQIPVAAGSKTYVCGSLLTEIRVSNLAWGMDVLGDRCVVRKRSLRRAELSFRGVRPSVVCSWVCDPEASRIRKPWPALGRSATGKKIIPIIPKRVCRLPPRIRWKLSSSGILRTTTCCVIT
jgi:hypothetical protein